jgi:hypothetical protein
MRIYLVRIRFVSQLQLHSILGNAHVDATLGGHGPQFRRELVLVAGDNLRAAMRDDGSRYAFFFAPRQLGANRGMANECFAAFPNERARYSRAITNINLDVLERRSAIVNKYEIGNVKNAGAPCAEAISDSRSKNRMFNGERLKCDAANLRGCTLLNQMPIFDGTPC